MSLTSPATTGKPARCCSASQPRGRCASVAWLGVLLRSGRLALLREVGRGRVAPSGRPSESLQSVRHFGPSRDANVTHFARNDREAGEVLLCQSAPRTVCSVDWLGVLLRSGRLACCSVGSAAGELLRQAARRVAPSGGPGSWSVRGARGVG